MLEFIKKLQNFDVSSLGKINLNVDISQIDFKPIRESLSNRTDTFLNIFFVLATLWGLHHLWGISNIQMTTIKTEIAELEVKQKTAIALEDKKKSFATFQKTIPQGFATETEIIKKVIDLATARKVNVIFYSPTLPVNEKYYLIQTINFIFESTYADMLSLVQALEKNKENLYINSWKKNNDNRYQQFMGNKKTAQKTETFKWEISVSSTRLNDAE
jgi:hypothetical protein